MSWIRNPSDELALGQGCSFSEAEGLRVVGFVEEFCKQSRGRWAGTPLTLMDWQRDFLMRLFGWRGPEGRRRFRTAYLEVAKKNGKSTLLSALAVYLCIGDRERGAEVYLNAVDREQASIIFDEAARMVNASPELSKRLEVIASRKRIVDPVHNGRIVANSADVPSKDGINAHGIIFDEMHRLKSRDLWDIMEYAGAAREQPIRIGITTAGDATEGVWYEQREYSERVDAGVIPDVSHLGVVYRALEGDDLDDPATWRKANPSLGETIREDDFARELREAVQSPVKFANFKRLRLNIVSAGDSAYVDIADWDACGGSHECGMDDPCYMGIDLSQTQDLTALVCLVGEPAGGFDVFARFWLPEDGIELLERRHRVPYRQWAADGYLTLTPGNVIDYEFVRAEVNALAAGQPPTRILMDPYNATKLGLELKEQDGLPIEYLRQGFLSLGDPTRELHRLILSRRLRHEGHPILRWHVANCVAEQNAAGSMKLSKKKSRHKIDGAAALVNAVAAATSGADDGRSVYEDRGILVL
ncbi:unnamed protein product [uncultured bacterium]|nr:unnamed protein product [uncultured bacterium]